MLIYATGSNFFGQLGQGKNKGASSTSKDPACRGLVSHFGCSDESNLDPKEVDDIQCGSTFTAVLKKNGSVNICGTVNGYVFPNLIPLEIALPLKCMQVACGRKHILLLMERHIVMSWGTGYFGQLGHGDSASWSHPRMIGMLEPKRLGQHVVSVACGGAHSGALTDSGRVFLWGLNRSGQCAQQAGTGGGSSSSSKGDEAAESVPEPRPVDLSPGRCNTTPAPPAPPGTAAASSGASFVVQSLVLSRNHSCALTTTGRVFCWGDSGFGRLGLQDCKKTQPVPSEVAVFRAHPVSQLAAGDFHMLALTQDGQVYSWGYGADGQTGHNAVSEQLQQPWLVCVCVCVCVCVLYYYLLVYWLSCSVRCSAMLLAERDSSTSHYCYTVLLCFTPKIYYLISNIMPLVPTYAHRC
jgi:alpha-tubulin suppressor-like RCC1 family protein